MKSEDCKKGLRVKINCDTCRARVSPCNCKRHNGKEGIIQTASLASVEFDLETWEGSHDNNLVCPIEQITPIEAAKEEKVDLLKKIMAVRTPEEAKAWLGAIVAFGGREAKIVGWERMVENNHWLTYSKYWEPGGHEGRPCAVGSPTGSKSGHWWILDEDIRAIRLEKVGDKRDEKSQAPCTCQGGHNPECESDHEAAPVETFPGGFKVGDRVRIRKGGDTRAEFYGKAATVCSSEIVEKDQPPGLSYRKGTCVPFITDEQVEGRCVWFCPTPENLEHIKESEPIKKEEAMKNGEILECNFGGNDWFRGVIVREERNIANALFYSAAAADRRVGHNGGYYDIDKGCPKSSEHGHWYLHSQMEGIEWRKFGKGSEPPSEHIPDQACGDDGRECKDRDKMTIEAGGAVNRLEVTCRFCGSSYFAAAPEKHYHDPRYFDTRLGEPLPEPDLWNCTNPQCGASGRYIDYPPPMGDCPKCGSEIQDRPKR